MASSNYDLLKTKWQTDLATAYSAGDITQPVYYEALIALDQWLAAEASLTSAMGSEVTAYTIAGRQVTRSGHGFLQEAVSRSKAKFFELIHGNVTLADFHEADESTSANLR
jgi:hypothetical protein